MLTGPQRRKVLTSALLVLIFGSLLLSLKASAQQLTACGVTNASTPCVQKFVDPLPIPGVFSTTTIMVGGQATDFYDIGARQFQQQMLSSNTGLMTTVWGYGPANDPANSPNFHTPSMSIVAAVGRPVEVKWENQFDTSNGTYQPGVPVITNRHWANPQGNCARGQTPPDCAGIAGGTYTAPVPMIVHAHGIHARSESDGIPEAWYLPPSASTIFTHGTDYAQCDSNLNASFMYTPGAATFCYPNDPKDQPATFLVFHDHTLGVTEQNVYMGLAGGYLLKGGPNDCSGATVPTCVLPSGPYEIPLVIQDRAFDINGQLLFNGGEIFSGNVIVVNGKSWPYLNVEPRKYRFHVANFAPDRSFDLSFSRSDTPAQPTGCQTSATFPDFLQIGGDQGFLPCPIDLAGIEVGKSSNLHLAAAERADIIIDFTGQFGKTFRFGGAVQFRVNVPLNGTDNTVIPSALPAEGHLGTPTNTIRVAIFDDHTLGTVVGSGLSLKPVAQEWDAAITEAPTASGSVQEWDIYNFADDAHPIHLHAVRFNIVNRESLSCVMNNTPCAVEPTPGEAGFKDTVDAAAKSVTRVKAVFDNALVGASASNGTTGLFAWHCHIATHEDLQMMRPYCILDSTNSNQQQACESKQ